MAFPGRQKASYTEPLINIVCTCFKEIFILNNELKIPPRKNEIYGLLSSDLKKIGFIKDEKSIFFTINRHKDEIEERLLEKTSPKIER